MTYRGLGIGAGSPGLLDETDHATDLGFDDDAEGGGMVMQQDAENSPPASFSHRSQGP